MSSLDICRHNIPGWQAVFSWGHDVNKLRPLIVLGMRPEAIKLAPVLWECQARPEQVEPIVCVTGQHRDMLAPLLEYFRIVPDDQLDLMTANQTLATLTARCLDGIDGAAMARRPHCIVAQGDTTTVMAAAMVASHCRIPFVHVEAGLRTGDLQAPWPEEFNRRVADMVSDLYCVPTRRACRYSPGGGRAAPVSPRHGQYGDRHAARYGPPATARRSSPGRASTNTSMAAAWF